MIPFVSLLLLSGCTQQATPSTPPGPERMRVTRPAYPCGSVLLGYGADLYSNTCIDTVFADGTRFTIEADLYVDNWSGDPMGIDPMLRALGYRDEICQYDQEPEGWSLGEYGVTVIRRTPPEKSGRTWVWFCP